MQWRVGPDIFDLSVDDTLGLIHTTFANTTTYYQSYPDRYPGPDHPAHAGASAVDTLGYTPAGDSVCRLELRLAHSSATVRIAFSATGLQEMSDESWGIDNVAVAMPQSWLRIRHWRRCEAGASHLEADDAHVR